jgi:hypothetical protein
VTWGGNKFLGTRATDLKELSHSTNNISLPQSPAQVPQLFRNKNTLALSYSPQ